MSISPEILAAQAEYASRKWSVFVNVYEVGKGGSSGTYRFKLFREAVEYATREVIRCASPNRGATFEYNIEGPGGEFPIEFAHRFVGVVLNKALG